MCTTIQKGFIPSVLIAILIFLRSMSNLRFRKSMLCHCVESTGCLIISASCLCFSLCHYNNSDSFLFANQRFKRGMIGKYQNTFLGPPFLLFLLQFSSSPPSFLQWNRSSPQIGHFLRSSYSGPRYRMPYKWSQECVDFLHLQTQWIDYLFCLINGLRNYVALG
jgi:hypothetical protein